jgi:hypothetical protein
VADGAVELEAAVLNDGPVGVPRPDEEEVVVEAAAEVREVEVEVEVMQMFFPLVVLKH